MKHFGCEETLNRFMSKVDKTTSCWNWKSCTSRGGYGKFGIGGVVYYAHRISWQIHNGEIPSGKHVLHRCDNPRCVNPDHLFVGTAKDNMMDASKKHRTSHGESRPSSKLTNSQAEKIRELHRLGVKQKVLAGAFAVSKATVCMLVNGNSWKHANKQKYEQPITI